MVIGSRLREYGMIKQTTDDYEIKIDIGGKDVKRVTSTKILGVVEM